MHHMATHDEAESEGDERRRLRVGYPCAPALLGRATWALEALMARRAVRDWELVTERGAAVDLDIPHSPVEWQFAQEMAPDAARDPLATTFWWLARVEELLANEEHFDEHGRFRFEYSALERSRDPFATPVDDIALGLAVPASRSDDERRALEQGPPWRLVATHDIDQPWRWTPRGRKRAMRSVRDHLRGGRYRDAFATCCALLAARWWKLRRDDPWCNAERIRELEQRHHARSTSYVLVDARVPADGDPDMHDRGGPRYIERLIAPTRARRGRGRHSAGGVVGLHGSYTVLHDADRLEEERANAERLAGMRITDHRFHYLRHQPVRDWPRLAAAGLTSDASLGYAEQPGFRAGTAHPFRAWDHENDRALDLIIIPLAFMDASLEERYLDLDPITGGRDIVDDILATLERTGGSVSVLWHNDKLCTVDSRRWTRLYRYLLASVERRGGVATTAHEAALAYRALLPTARG
jgi:hypothetical protein